MKIVGFESSEGLRLGVVEGDDVIDLQAVDAKVPVNLADVLKQNNGDLKSLGDLAKRAPASARKPLKGLKYGLPVARPGKVICLGLNYMEHVKEGMNRDNHLHALPDFAGAAPAIHHSPEGHRNARL
jgi:acylpyruvate hydrolase